MIPESPPYVPIQLPTPCQHLKSGKGIQQQMQTFAREIWEQNRQKEELKVSNRSKAKALLPLPHLSVIS